MNNEATTAQAKTRNQTRVMEQETVQAGIDSVSKASLFGMGIVSGVIGVWASLYFLTAMMSDGPVTLIKSWFSAVGWI